MAGNTPIHGQNQPNGNGKNYYLEKVYEQQLPDELYLVTGQWNAFVDTFVELGYEVEPIVDINAKLYYMTR